jgi:hypothetical protein
VTKIKGSYSATTHRKNLKIFVYKLEIYGNISICFVLQVFALLLRNIEEVYFFSKISAGREDPVRMVLDSIPMKLNALNDVL